MDKQQQEDMMTIYLNTTTDKGVSVYFGVGVDIHSYSFTNIKYKLHRESIDGMYNLTKIWYYNKKKQTLREVYRFELPNHQITNGRKSKFLATPVVLKKSSLLIYRLDLVQNKDNVIKINVGDDQWQPMYSKK